MCSWCLILLVTLVFAQLLVHSVGLVHHCRWSLLTVVLVLLVLRLTSRVLTRCLMGDFLRQIHGCRAIRLQGMAFLFGRRVQVRASCLRIG
jgi:hypothetical protein